MNPQLIVATGALVLYMKLLLFLPERITGVCDDTEGSHTKQMSLNIFPLMNYETQVQGPPNLYCALPSFITPPS